MDCGFPLIRYVRGNSSREWGRCHGESARAGIAELASIRREKLLEILPKNLRGKVSELAEAQWEATLGFSHELAQELSGIREGADLPLVDLMILNNYTDFRDMAGEDQGCSCVFLETDSELLAGQTWDMHRSAKDYVCAIEIEGPDGGSQQVLFSLVGCPGMMGFSAWSTAVGVNNLNTRGAHPGVIWPVMVRRLLRAGGVREMEDLLFSVTATSGRNYLVASPRRAQMWEVTPDCREKVSEHVCGRPGYLYHTNHCLGRKVAELEMPSRLASTTHKRMELLEGKVPGVGGFDDLVDLLGDHEGFPQSICSHAESHPQDPSHTCGGGVGELRTGKVTLWRGCREHDDSFKSREFSLATEAVKV